MFFTNWSKWDTAFAAELDSIKLNFPELVENNLLLQFLQRDDSLRKNKNNKPESVSLKLKKSQLEPDTIDILSNSFNDLLNFYDNNYTLEQQKEIRDFADKLADFSFVQSGLSKTPYSFSNVIPNDVYADKINKIIKAFKELMDNDPTKAKKEIKRFNNKFKENNSKFFVAYYDEQSGGMDIDFAKNETSRGKNYLLGGIVDLLDLNKNANELLAQKENEKLIEYIQSHSSTATEAWDKETAKNNKNNLYIYESNKSDSGMVGTAKVKSDSKNPESNTKGIALMEKASLPADVDKNKDAYFSDSKLTENIAIIDKSIKDILDDIKKRMSENKPYTNIIFPVNGIVEISFLKEKAPLTYNYLINKLNDTFGTNYQTTENTKFEVSQDAEPVIYPSTEEDDNYRERYEDNFDYIPSQIDLSEEEQELSMINLEWDKALEFAEYTLPKGKTIGEHTQAINKEFQAKVDAIKGNKPSVPTQPSTQPSTSVKSSGTSIVKNNWTKDSPKENPNTAYIFTENINSIGSSRVGGGSAIIRNNPNAIGIVTKKYYVYAEDRATSKVTGGWNQDFQDTKEDFELFKKVNLEQFAKIDKYESKIFPQGFASDLAKIPTRFAEWLQSELLNRYGLITELNANKTGLISKSIIQPSTTEVVPFSERIRKEYPQTINVNGINLNTDKLLEFNSFEQPTEEKALEDKEVEKYGKISEYIAEYVYLSKELAEWIKNNPEFSKNLIDAYVSDESEEVIEKDLDFYEYSKYLLDKNVRLIDVNQLNLFDKEETDTPNCII